MWSYLYADYCSLLCSYNQNTLAVVPSGFDQGNDQGISKFPEGDPDQQAPDIGYRIQQSKYDNSNKDGDNIKM